MKTIRMLVAVVAGAVLAAACTTSTPTAPEQPSRQENQMGSGDG